MSRSATPIDKPYTVYTVQRRSRWRWVRVALTTLLLFLTLAIVAVGGTYVWLDLKVGQTHSGKNGKAAEAALTETTTSVAGVAETVTTLEPPNAQNILVLGSDNREGEGEKYGRSDTLMIVHIDPEQDFVSVLSLPRDLRVEIAEGRGTQKINAAYALGGDALAIKTVQQVTGVDLDHYVNIDFNAFRDVTKALGGIYVDVDRRYYYKGDDYEIIDLKPGYQALAGEAALDYVRFRHDDNNDFGRIIRQQRFLRAAKEQISKWDAALKIPTLVNVLARNVNTDMTTNQLLKLGFWGVRLGGGHIKQVDLVSTTDLIGGASYVIAADDAIRDAVRDLMTPPESGATVATTSTTGGEAGTGDTSGETSSGSTGATASPTTAGPAPKVDLTGVSVDVQNGNGRSGEGAATASWLRSLGAQIGKIGDASTAGITHTRVEYPPKKKSAAQLVARAVGSDRLVADSSVGRITVVLGEDYALPAGSEVSLTIADLPDKGEYLALRKLSGVPMVAPSYLPDGYKRKDSRMYEIQAGDEPKPAVKVVYQYERDDQYLGLMATTFTDAPAASAGQEVTVNGTTYTIVNFGGKVDHVWWVRDGVLFWVSNTLSYLVDREEMLKVATGMVPVP